jgi:hypothetical protein
VRFALVRINLKLTILIDGEMGQKQNGNEAAQLGFDAVSVLSWSRRF